MTAPSYRGYRFPADVIQRAVWMYLRFTLSCRDVEGFVTSLEQGRKECPGGWVQAATPAA